MTKKNSNQLTLKQRLGTALILSVVSTMVFTVIMYFLDSELVWTKSLLFGLFMFLAPALFPNLFKLKPPKK